MYIHTHSIFYISFMYKHIYNILTRQCFT